MAPSVIVVSQADVERLLDLDELLEALAEAHADLSAGRVSMPLRIAAEVPGKNAILAAMPAYLPSADALTAKLVSLFPQNDPDEHPTHQALVLAFDPENGEPLALLDGTSITAIRTGAAAALSARLVARPSARTLALLGAGVQAKSHARAFARVRDLAEIRVASRNADRAKDMAHALEDELGIATRAVGSYEEAVRGADLVAATTHSPEPVVRREWLSPGVHVTSVGVKPDGREVDAETVRDALVVVESRSAALAPFPAGSNDLLWPLRDGLIEESHIHAELGELVLGTKSGRVDDEQITLYKSVGVAIQDAAAAALLLRSVHGARSRAETSGRGAAATD